MRGSAAQERACNLAAGASRPSSTNARSRTLSLLPSWSPTMSPSFRLYLHALANRVINSHIRWALASCSAHRDSIAYAPNAVRKSRSRSLLRLCHSRVRRSMLSALLASLTLLPRAWLYRTGN